VAEEKELEKEGKKRGESTPRQATWIRAAPNPERKTSDSITRNCREDGLIKTPNAREL